MSNNIRYAEIWFKQAKYDLEADLVSKENGSYEWACFQAQQSAEKALKAFLFLNRIRNVILHSIRKLIEECGVINKEFLKLKKANGLKNIIVHRYNEIDEQLILDSVEEVKDYFL